MAFDFNGKNRPASTPNSTAEWDIDFDSLNADSEFSDRDTGGFGGRRDRTNGFGRRPAGNRLPSEETTRRQTGFQDRPAGYSNRHEQNGSRNNPPAGSTRMPPRPPAKRPAAPRGGSGRYMSIPWGIIFLVIGIIIAVILCVVFRAAITDFLAQVLAWVIVVLIIVCLLKWLVFGGRRRR